MFCGFLFRSPASLMAGINGAIAQYHRHRERLAMIEQGIDPDAHKDRDRQYV